MKKDYYNRIKQYHKKCEEDFIDSILNRKEFCDSFWIKTKKDAKEYLNDVFITNNTYLSYWESWYISWLKDIIDILLSFEKD